METTLVSTIIPVYNRPHMIREAVESVLHQTHRPVEIILVDDGSTDETPDTLRDLAAQNPDTIKLIHQDNSGPGAARNTGLRHACGRFIQYLDSDDLLHPEKFKQQIARLQAHPDADVCYCITLRRHPSSGRMVPWAKTDQEIIDLFPSFLPKRGWATLTPLWRRDACDRIGPWSDCRVLEDWEHDLRAGILGIRPVQVRLALCTVRDHGDQRASGMNSGYTPALTGEVFRAHELVWQQMQRHQLVDWRYTERFCRSMFWLARMCGERGLYFQAERALTYADEIAAAAGRRPVTRTFRRVRTILGWQRTVRWGELLRRLKP